MPVEFPSADLNELTGAPPPEDQVEWLSEAVTDVAARLEGTVERLTPRLDEKRNVRDEEYA